MENVAAGEKGVYFPRQKDFSDKRRNKVEKYTQHNNSGTFVPFLFNFI